MCLICHHSPCLSRCPNAPDPPAVFRCYRCGEAIYPGDEYASIDGVEYCESCVDDMPYCELVPLLGGEWKTVQAGEKIKCDDCEELLPIGTEYGVIDGSVMFILAFNVIKLNFSGFFKKLTNRFGSLGMLAERLEKMESEDMGTSMKKGS